jgi:hypothetical protein
VVWVQGIPLDLSMASASSKQKPRARLSRARVVCMAGFLQARKEPVPAHWVACFLEQ